MRAAQDYEDSWIQGALQGKGFEPLDIQIGIKS
jgi:hypothetical protein